MALSQMAEKFSAQQQLQKQTQITQNGGNKTNNESVDLDNLFAFLTEVTPNGGNSNEIINEIGEKMNHLVEDLDVELESVIQQEIEGLTNEKNIAKTQMAQKKVPPQPPQKPQTLPNLVQNQPLPSQNNNNNHMNNNNVNHAQNQQQMILQQQQQLQQAQILLQQQQQQNKMGYDFSHSHEFSQFIDLFLVFHLCPSQRLVRRHHPPNLMELPPRHLSPFLNKLSNNNNHKRKSFTKSRFTRQSFIINASHKIIIK
jgi:hypothetical protein